MYEDRTQVREHEIKVRLSDAELAVVDALARYNRRQRAAFIRDLVMDRVARSEMQVTDKQQAA
jgi:hypothetical protein